MKNDSTMIDFEEMILRRRLEDSEESAEVFETLRNQNKVYVNNPNQLIKTEVISLNYNQLKPAVRKNISWSKRKIDSNGLKESNVVTAKKEPKHSGTKKELSPIQVEKNGVHPVFQNKRLSSGDGKRWKARKVEGKGDRNLSPDSPNNARNSTQDFDYDNYHKKIDIQHIKTESHHSKRRNEEARDEKIILAQVKNRSNDASMRNVGHLRAEGTNVTEEILSQNPSMTRIVKTAPKPKKRYPDLSNSDEDESNETMETGQKQPSQEFMFKAETKEAIQQSK